MLKVRLVLRHAVWKLQRQDANEVLYFVEQAIYTRHILQNDRLLHLQQAKIKFHLISDSTTDIKMVLLLLLYVLIKVTLNEICCRGTLQSQWSTLTESTSLYIKAEESVKIHQD